MRDRFPRLDLSSRVVLFYFHPPGIAPMNHLWVNCSRAIAASPASETPWYLHVLSPSPRHSTS
ncbi:MAG TPA: hypothetical protein IGS37_13995 [Synechococcales cyanobacterium M55_K2018_004]|nr:hypothetical protein [Synechococcales cyanobacterium M55_K2018_004]